MLLSSDLLGDFAGIESSCEQRAPATSSPFRATVFDLASAGSNSRREDQWCAYEGGECAPRSWGRQKSLTKGIHYPKVMTEPHTRRNGH